MKIRFKTWTLGLVAVVLVSACAPAATATSAPVIPTVALPVPATSTPASVAPANTDIPVAPTPTPVVEVLPVATSRGPDLEATDPTTVALASGSLQLVEFFRFT